VASRALPPSDRPPSYWAPLRHRAYRTILIGTFGAYTGTWIQSVGAAWLMLSLTESTDLVASVQTAANLPPFMLALVGGALADIFDRRRVVMAAQGLMIVSALLLSLFQTLDLMTPWLLLAMTFLLNSGSAARLPAYQAAVAEMVPVEDLPSAVALNGLATNLARSIGPGIGGIIVAAFGPETSFVVNALLILGAMSAMALWRRTDRKPSTQRQHLLSAIADGITYSVTTHEVRRLLVRVSLFGFAAAALWALMPLVAKQEVAGGPFTYGIMIGSIGIGAICGGMLVPRLRWRFGADRITALAPLGYASALIALSAIHVLTLLLPFLLLAGIGWMLILSLLIVQVQMFVPDWIKARALSAYYTCLFGSMAAGSAFFGHLAAETSVSFSLLAAGTMMLATSLVMLSRSPVQGERD
jgi:MFS family permease